MRFEDIEAPLLSYWGVEAAGDELQKTTSYSFTLSSDTTLALFGKCNDAYRTRPMELMIACLLHAFDQTFTDRPLPTIWNEGHGREVWDDSLDLSRTCGWFTTLVPVQISGIKQQTLQEFIRRVKDYIRSIPQNGWSYFVSRFVNKDSCDKFISNLPVEIMFNYSGGYGQLERGDSLFENITAPASRDLQTEMASTFRRHAVFDVLAGVQRGQLAINFVFPQTIASRMNIERWIAQYQSTLESLASESVISERSSGEKNISRLTLSDFPGLFGSYEAIDEFHTNVLPALGIDCIDDIEHIYPAAPTQEGILISQAKDPKSYHSRLHIVVSSNERGPPIDVKRLQDAWRSVSRRHDLLRAVFIREFPGNSRIMQAILANPKLSIHVHKNATDLDVTRLMHTQLSPHYQQSGLQHHLDMLLVDERKANLILEINHAIIDGYSTNIIARDLKSAYEHADVSLTPSVSSYGDFVMSLDGQSREEGLEFWAASLAGTKACHFPGFPTHFATIGNAALNDEQKQRDQDESTTVKVPLLDTNLIRQFCQALEITPATVVQLAWAVVLRWYTNSLDTCFGILCSGRDLPIDGVDEIFGPLICMLICRVQFSVDGMTVAEALEQVHASYVEGLRYQTFSLAAVHNALGLGSDALFNSVVSFQKAGGDAEEEISRGQEGGSVQVSLVGGYDPTEYGVSVRAIDTPDELFVFVDCQSAMSAGETDRIGQCFSTAIASIVANSQSPIKELDVLSVKARDQIWQWNHVVPRASDKCVHDLIEEMALTCSNKVGISSWDGDLTYKDITEHAGRLANSLVGRGLAQETIVPLCFEKSKWTVVAMLGVLRAGGAFVLLDPSQPEDRLSKIIQQTKATTGLSSLANSKLMSRMLTHVVVVAEDSFYSITSSLPGDHKRGNSASLIFDVSINTLMMVLASGGCVCVPSEVDRKNSLTEAIVSFGVNTIDVTPSVCRLLNPNDMPLVHTMILGGEQLRATDIAHWPGHVKILNCYGPSECTPTSTINDIQGTSFITGIGKAAGAVVWIVDPIDHNVLAPPGTVGELLIEGPIVGQGYLGDPERTSASFIHDPDFLLRGSASYLGREGYLYKTGDLVRYQSDGNLTYIGRKDTQVKLRGQRVELEDVEHHALASVPGAKEVVVEVITPSGEGGGQQLLAAFVLLIHQDHTKNDGFRTQGGAGVSALSGTLVIEDSLSQRLPNYMVPTVWFAIDAMPLTLAGKTDRRKLREIGSSYSMVQLNAQRSGNTGDKRIPTTDVERTLQSLWSHTLGVQLGHIGLDDNFFRLGGDSLRAMSLVSTARKSGLGLSVAQIFEHPRLGDIANELLSNKHTHKLSGNEGEPEPFALLSWPQDHFDGFTDQGSMALSTKFSGEYIIQNVMQIAAETDCHRLQQSWVEAVRLTLMLRTRIVQHHASDLMLQVVLQSTAVELAGGIQWQSGDDLETYLECDKTQPMHLGEPLVRYAIIRDDGQSYLVWTIHHAVYDGQSLPAIQTLVRNIYHARTEDNPLHLPFNTFVRHLLMLDESASKTFWGDYFAEYQSTAFPPLPSSFLENTIKADVTIGLAIDLPSLADSSVTMATIIRAAWAQAIHHNTGSSDIVFGATLSGRNAPIAGIEDIIGPTIATVPVRIKVPQRPVQSTVLQFLLDVQAKSTAMIPHEQFGLHKISKISENAQQGCEFKTLLIIQPHEEDDSADLSQVELGTWLENAADTTNFSTYPLTVVCRLSSTGSMHIGCSVDSRVLTQWRAEKILEHFGLLVQQLSSMDLDQSIEELHGLMLSDRELIWTWNEHVPEPVDTCLHDLIHQRAMTQPNAPALCCWDGEMSYCELDAASSSLASYLVDNLGIAAGSMVPLCFEKSRWAVVSMVAVLKAGAAFVPLDPAQPTDRRDMVLRQVNGSVMLASEHLAGEIDASSSFKAIAVGPQLLACLEHTVKSKLVSRPGSPDGIAYIIFTSGSTGLPKGVIIDNRAISTSCSYHGRAIGLTKGSRVLQFASHAFDASIQEVITTLIYGGTVCIPSEYDLRNNLTHSIFEMQVNTAYLTPSVARLIDASSVPNLKTLMLAGESSTSRDFLNWLSPGQTLLHGYGPTECAVLCCVAQVGFGATEEVNPACIGTATGGTSWIVDAADHNKLLPVGAVGELLIEGHILARSYLHDQAVTDRVFIETPSWLSRGVSRDGRISGRRGRLYKTGDLVSYNADGSLNYIGRKDSQIKIRGQRVELTDVEASVKQSFQPALQVVAEIIQPAGEGANPALAVFMVLGSDGLGSLLNKTQNGVQIGVLSVPMTVENQLAELVPSYMVPSVWFIVDQLPLNTSGKTNRKKLRDIGSSFSASDLAALRRIEGTQKRNPSTEVEKSLCVTIGRVLNVSEVAIGLDDNFFHLGGDSITAMQLSAAARQKGLNISVEKITRFKTVSRILEACNADIQDISQKTGYGRDPMDDEDDNLDQAVALSPIQQMFFLHQPNTNVCFDQFFYLQPRALISHSVLELALNKIVTTHPLLRARFRKTDTGVWEQFIESSPAKTLRCLSRTCSNYEQVALSIQHQRADLNITSGPLVAAVLYDVDEVTLAPPTTSFRSWSSLQAQHAVELVAAREQTKANPPPRISYWTGDGLTTHVSRDADSMTLAFSLDESTTTAILGACNEFLGTKPVELMISALLFSFGQTFRDRPLPTIFNEGHGRGTWDETLDMDLSRTVGWFTTLYPIHLHNSVTNSTGKDSAQQHTLLDFVANTHEAMAASSSPQSGASFFTSQFATPESARSFVKGQLPAEIVFNYGGVYQQLERDDSFFQIVSLDAMASKHCGVGGGRDDCGKRSGMLNISPLSAAEAHRYALFEVIAGVTKGRLGISVIYSRHLLHGVKIKAWFAEFEAVMRRIVRELGNAGSV
ncbi:HC-toxin synthetase [Verticillium alfalfae VaMs.102]|uniref:HC-toxin synthetase n=1 Tax=Verticillium alfalfae (strain VaMs.102 / ATCC MYA-4576 / FGSC 10136) TaxID=526221 RepID=C9STV9_VERA1|nr:HC-toxin synthetase [Verticillium alfalfae VaMs.102]EEY22270.1 HC-toxin synthetase [Verticillium alfalfae VaMs.102]